MFKILIEKPEGKKLLCELGLIRRFIKNWLAEGIIQLPTFLIKTVAM
jgi:hypothetical protein